jgi:hypothetical protein
MSLKQQNWEIEQLECAYTHSIMKQTKQTTFSNKTALVIGVASWR